MADDATSSYDVNNAGFAYDYHLIFYWQKVPCQCNTKDLIKSHNRRVSTKSQYALSLKMDDYELLTMMPILMMMIIRSFMMMKMLKDIRKKRAVRLD